MSCSPACAPLDAPSFPLAIIACGRPLNPDVGSLSFCSFLPFRHHRCLSTSRRRRPRTSLTITRCYCSRAPTVCCPGVDVVCGPALDPLVLAICVTYCARSMVWAIGACTLFQVVRSNSLLRWCDSGELLSVLAIPWGWRRLHDATSGQGSCTCFGDTWTYSLRDKAWKVRRFGPPPHPMWMPMSN